MTFRRALRKSIFLPAALAGACVFFGAGSSAHHAFIAQYDENAPATLTGVVVKVDWLNPHAYFYLDVEDEDSGEITTWACELGSPASMQRQGWTREALTLGDILIVKGSLARDGSHSLSASSVVVESTGERLFSRRQN